MTETPDSSTGSPRLASTLVLYYIASALWMLAGIVTMVAKPGDGPRWLPYFCVMMGMVFMTLARRKRRAEDAADSAS